MLATYSCPSAYQCSKLRWHIHWKFFLQWATTLKKKFRQLILKNIFFWKIKISILFDYQMIIILVSFFHIEIKKKKQRRKVNKDINTKKVSSKIYHLFQILISFLFSFLKNLFWIILFGIFVYTFLHLIYFLLRFCFVQCSVYGGERGDLHFDDC